MQKSIFIIVQPAIENKIKDFGVKVARLVLLETRLLFFSSQVINFFSHFVLIFFFCFRRFLKKNAQKISNGAKLQSQTDNNCRSFDTKSF